ncbi:hypothetical protein G8A07_09195 [Roseateles sp. DAIF2]|uniref:XrtB/PEP-CTERM-associated transcriptional regulator EpsA n=1 Tax=Roseateles sp. DAIF2 TaxID=2714952 RepID=UPI0018A290DB|nr:XrtB/PEP-CTERM-associated transcriptional regulator EpsA [Roseateles sp. DAIF2]QPF73074.1 hypothetical protein G8A07_09195 [Roseateles sp. DAIF2]
MTTKGSLEAEALMRAADSALEVRRRYQFFVWMQSHLQPLLPHQLAICGAYKRAARELVFDVFNTVPLPDALLSALSRNTSPLMQRLQLVWLQARCRPVSTGIMAPDDGVSPDTQVLIDAGVGDMLVHGLSRPQRPSEIEGFYVFARVGAQATPAQCRHLELLLPHIHATWQRVQNFEHELSPMPSMQPQRGAHPTGITERERQILAWLREGKSNQQIGEGLGISALTVKNHVQKILRKLRASNRAQAVACAMTLNLLDHHQLPGLALFEAPKR